MLTQEEIEKYRKRYTDESDIYRRVSEYILKECLEHKRRYPNRVRVVFSREPVIKTFGSLIDKIVDKRKTEDPNYGYDDLSDIIALTVLCPYRSDVDDFIVWMRRSFTVLTPDEQALRDDPRGHRGYHYTVTVDEDTLQKHPEHRDFECEIQVLTVLEEAFDAKSHDLTYKPKIPVTEELTKQFGILSMALKAIDEQSGFLKDLILAQEKELELRRKACVLLYLEAETVEVARTLSIDLDGITSRDIPVIVQKFKAVAPSAISTNFCKLVALCALKLDDDYLKDEAVRYAEIVVSKAPQNAWHYVVRGSIKWALGRFEGAIQDVTEALNLASGVDDRALQRGCRNCLIYFVSDWKSLKRAEKLEWTSLAERYSRELSDDLNDPNEIDTVGFYRIAFGTIAGDIESGRELIKDSRRRRSGDEAYEYFFRYHEIIALTKLLWIARKEEGN